MYEYIIYNVMLNISPQGMYLFSEFFAKWLSPLKQRFEMWFDEGKHIL